MDGRMLTPITADVLHNHLLWRSVVFASLLGLALTQTTVPNMSTPDMSQAIDLNTHGTVESLSSATVTSIAKKKNSSLTTTPVMTSIATTNLTLTTNQTALIAPSPTPAITKPLSTIPVTMMLSSPVATPELKQSTTQPKETSIPPKPLPFTRPGPVPVATSKDNGHLTPTGGSIPQDSTNHVALYLLLPLVVLAGIAMLVMIASYLRKKIRLDKLRHQLLPLYTFDPQEGEDWETELLTEPRANSRTPLNTTKPLVTTTVIAEIPKLRFTPDSVDV